MTERPFNFRQRQQKGLDLVRIDARVKPETEAWLKRIKGDSSVGIAIDLLYENFSTFVNSSGTK